jgi:hypothetical protein
LPRSARTGVAELTRLGFRLLLFLLALSPARARAAAMTQSLVFLRSDVATHPSLERVVEATRGPLAELGVELLVAARPSSAELGAMSRAAHAVADATHAIAVVWLDNPSADDRGSVVYVFDPLRKRLFTRALAVDESETAAAEEVAVVLRSAVSALSAGAEIAMTEVKIPEPVKPPPPPAPKREPARARAPQHEHSAELDVGLGYVGTIVAKDWSWQSGARLSLDVRPARSRWVFGAAYQLLPPLRAESSQVTTRLYRHPAEITLGLRLFGDSFRLEPELALVADRVQRETERAEAPLVGTARSARWLWAVSARVRGRWLLTRRVSAVAAAGADFVLNPFEQEVEAAAGRTQLYSLLTIRPLAEAGLALDFW